MGAKLLLADDSVTIQKVVELTLADKDYDITMASDGASALEMAEKMKPDLVLADIVMPELNGYELCEKIRQNPRLSDVPVLLLSSTFETFDEERGQRVGANDHIVKPFESEELLAKIENLLKKPEPAEVESPIPEEAGRTGSGSPAFDDTVPELEKVEGEDFEFELTDEFMSEAEEMFEEPGETTRSDQPPEEVLVEQPLDFQPEEEAGSDTQTIPDELILSEASSDTATAETPDEISPELTDGDVDESEVEPMLEPSLDHPFETDQESDFSGEVSGSDESPEVNREVLEEEEINVYDIPEEFAESGDSVEPEETPFQVESTPIDLMDEFLAHDETGTSPDQSMESSTEADHKETRGDTQPLEAEPFMPAVPEREDSDAEPCVLKPESRLDEPEKGTQEEAEDSFEEVFPTQGATTSEWSPEVSSFGGDPETVSDQLLEKPLKMEISSGPAPAINEETLKQVIADMVEAKAAEIIERVAWEVIPDLAEELVVKEIQRLKNEVELSQGS